VSRRLENLLGALAVGLSDAISSAVETTTGHAGAMGAALATLAQEPGLGIEQLRVPLGRTLEKVLAQITSDRAHADLICRLCDLAACPQSVCPVDLAARDTQDQPAEGVMRP